MRNRLICCAVITLIVFAGIIAGCSKSSQPPSQSKFGVIDMPTAIRNHPKQVELQKVTREFEALAAEVESMQGAANTAGITVAPDITAGLNDAAAKEFNAKMAAKEQELNTQLDEAVAKVHQELSAEMDAYTQEVDKVYQPQIFSLQLKQKTVQLSKEEAATIQTEVDRLQDERTAKLAAKHKELAQKMDSLMAGRQAEAKKQLDAYGQQLNATIGGTLAAKQADLAQRVTLAAPDNGALAGKKQQMALKKQEVEALQDAIVDSIRDKAAQVAAEKGLEVVFANVQANINAVDITTAVISKFN